MKRDPVEGNEELFIGREQELKRLKKRIDLLEKDKSGSIIVLSGGAGSGKSYMVRAIKSYTLEKNFKWLEGICVSREGQGFHPLKEAFLAYREKKRKSYINLPLSIRIADRWSIEGKEKGIFNADNKNTLQSSLEYIKNVTDDSPFIFILEDLHWADKHTLLMMRYIAGNLNKIPAIFICLYRPEDSTDYNLLKETISFISHSKSVDYIHLEPLGKEDSKRLIEKILNAQPDSRFVDMFYESTGGNPLFITETLKSMLAKGTIVPEKDKYISDPSKIKWPSVVKYIVERKIIRLDEKTRTLLQYLSVLGKRFTFRLINEFMEMDEMDILDILDDIIERNILKETANSEEYEFYHKATQDLLYDSLSRGKKNLLHKKAAKVIERCHENNLEKYYKIIGEHYLDASSLPDAVNYLYKAAVCSEERGDIEDCINTYRRVNKMISENNIDVVDVNELADRLGKNLYHKGLTLFANGDSEASKDYIEEAVDLFSQNGMNTQVEKCTELLDQIEQ